MGITLTGNFRMGKPNETKSLYEPPKPKFGHHGSFRMKSQTSANSTGVASCYAKKISHVRAGFIVRER